MESTKLSFSATKLLSEITIYLKYARFLEDENRRETWKEIVERNMKMHLKRFPSLNTKIISIYEDYILPKKVLPSMRSIQFAGKAIETNETRMYNCAYLPIIDLNCFSESFYLLLGGTGVGFSVQDRHVSQLPVLIRKPIDKKNRIFIEDSVEGWADSIVQLIEPYFDSSKRFVEFDYSLIRPKGSWLKTAGGMAPGHEPLKTLHQRIESLLASVPLGTQLTSLNASDIMCHLADAVLAGGIRRAAMICLFDRDDQTHLEAKKGDWYKNHPQRARANYSMIILRKEFSQKLLNDWVQQVDKNRSGEPGVYLTNDLDWGTNPCCEIALKPFQFCNLSEINMTDVKSDKELKNRARAASFVATLQASYTDFPYLRSIWKKNTKSESLIGVSMTGLASGTFEKLDLHAAAIEVKDENAKTARLLGINPANRCTTVKPAGTTSLVFGSSSGIHAWHDRYYIRRIRLSKNDELAVEFQKKMPTLIEEDLFDVNSYVISIPQKAPSQASYRSEGVLALLDRLEYVYENWVVPGHKIGVNTHNISCTLSYKREELPALIEELWQKKDAYNGVTLLPYDGGTYQQAPFESISKEIYQNLVKELQPIEFNKLNLNKEIRNLVDQAACAGGVCEI